MNDIFRFKIAIQTILDYKKTTLILTLLFMVLAIMYSGMFPAFKESLEEMAKTGLFEEFSPFFGDATFDMATYVGFLNLELYQIFWMIILGIVIGFIAASIVSKEIEGKTIDILMSNPISRKQIIFEKFIGLIPMTLIINFGTMLAVIGITLTIGEELNFGNLFLTHIASIPYFLAILGIAILISVILNEKMKASITFIALLMGMYFIDMMSKTVPDYKSIGVISITHYFVPYDTLKYGEFNIGSALVLMCVTTVCMIISMIYFEHKDITV
jgi:ABC-2 type transport system permease protein